MVILTSGKAILIISIVVLFSRNIVIDYSLNLLFQLISIHYEKGSIVLTSNYNFDEWGRIFEDNVVASAIIDRLLHHARIFYKGIHSWTTTGRLCDGSQTLIFSMFVITS